MNLVGLGITRGKKAHNAATGNENYTYWVYNPNLPLETQTIIVAANEYDVTQDGFYLGVVTAYCNGTTVCPSFVSYGPWDFGGAGSAP